MTRTRTGLALAAALLAGTCTQAARYVSYIYTVSGIDYPNAYPYFYGPPRAYSTKIIASFDYAALPPSATYSTPGLSTSPTM